ncbi:hypothetical protein [Brevibacillus sp. NRS-1366]|uniref:hypothetical protein n=1 Tax=Brevibacillus sp. NRS-1366 TaxID=3233899 RepID=UPI003D20537E
MQNQQINEVLGYLKQSVQRLQMSTENHVFSNQIQNVTQSIQGIASKVIDLSGNGDTDQFQLVRKQLAKVRQDLHTLTSDMEQAQGPLVNTYRSSVGTSKEQFEKASTSEQQEMNMTAYQSLKTYQQEEQILDLFHQLNGHLMDLSHQVEKLTYSSEIPAPTYGKPVDFTNDPGPGLTTS